MKKFLEKIAFLPLFIWQLPQNILGLIFLIRFYLKGDLHLISYKSMCWAFKSRYMCGGISLGNFAFVGGYAAEDECVISHEQDGHTFDSKLFGPLYLIVIGLPSLMWARFRNREKHLCYYSFYTEYWANEHAGLEAEMFSDGTCLLRKKKRGA